MASGHSGAQSHLPQREAETSSEAQSIQRRGSHVRSNDVDSLAASALEFGGRGHENEVPGLDRNTVDTSTVLPPAEFHGGDEDDTMSEDMTVIDLSDWEPWGSDGGSRRRRRRRRISDAVLQQRVQAALEEADAETNADRTGSAPAPRRIPRIFRREFWSMRLRSLGLESNQDDTPQPRPTDQVMLPGLSGLSQLSPNALAALTAAAEDWNSDPQDDAADEERRRQALRRELERTQRVNLLHLFVLCLIPTALLLVVVSSILSETDHCDGPECYREIRTFVNAYTSRCICSAIRASRGDGQG